MDIDETLAEVFKLNQAYLDPNDRVGTSSFCLVLSQPPQLHTALGVLITPSFSCTKQSGHTGDHGAHGLAGSILASWADDSKPPKLTSGLF